MSKEKIFFKCLFFIFLIIGFHSSNLLAQEKLEGETSLNQIIIHTPIQKFNYGDELKITAKVKEEVEWMRFFYRAEGIEYFQVRNMEKLSDSSYLYIYDTSQLVTPNFEYYLSAKLKGKVIYYPEQAPEEFLKAIGETKKPLPEITEKIKPEKEKYELPLSINVDASIQQKISEEHVVEEEEATIADGNIMLSKFYKKGNRQINFDMNSAYTNHPLEGDDNFNLSNLALSLVERNHFLKIGDISLDTSKFTAYGLGRRGAEYQFNDQKFLFHLFDISSQQPKGWGELIPESDLSIYGGALGYSFFNQTLTTKAVYLTGKDDPMEGRNVSGSFLERRKGDVWALIEELKIFDDKLKITGEFAESKCDNLQDEQGAKKDNAWDIGVNYSYGILSLGGNYKYIGKDFNSIGYQYFTNDRKGYDTSLGISFKKIGLNLTYTDEQDNVDDDPNCLTSYDKDGTVSLSWDLSPKTSLNLGYGQNKQETFTDKNKEILFQDSLIKDASLGLNFLLSHQTSLNLSIVDSQLSSKTDSSLDSSTLTGSLGGSFKPGKSLSLSPNLSYSTSRIKVSGKETKTYNSFLSGELDIIPKKLSISTSGSFTRTEAPENTTINYTDISASLNWCLKGKILGLASEILSLRWDLEQTEGLSPSDKSERFMLQFNFSF